MLVLYVMSDGTAEQNLKQIFKIFDLNNDGKINHEEMEKISKDLSKLFKVKIKKYICNLQWYVQGKVNILILITRKIKLNSLFKPVMFKYRVSQNNVH